MKMLKVFSALLLACMLNLPAAMAADAPKASTGENEPGFCSKAGRFVMLYLPNLLADAFDVVSVEFSFGNSFAVDAHATYALNFALENSDTYFAGIAPQHVFAAGRREALRGAFMCFSSDSVYVSQTCGKTPSFALEDSSFNLVECYADAYKSDAIDFWAIGGKLAFIVGAAVDVHLRELPDFICQIFGYDLADDNWK
ncbi:MAG: hypothetical protein E7052_04675 [Lentisphaerae bacterium]|nr:hypothetical protein [Lentisphaerota bacterium]